MNYGKSEFCYCDGPVSVRYARRLGEDPVPHFGATKISNYCRNFSEQLYAVPFFRVKPQRSGSDFGANNHSYTAIESLDSDGDSFSNIDEINAHTFPGNSAGHPTVVTASITVKKPNGGEVWVQGTKVLVSWSSTGDIGTDVRIDFGKIDSN